MKLLILFLSIATLAMLVSGEHLRGSSDTRELVGRTSLFGKRRGGRGGSSFRLRTSIRRLLLLLLPQIDPIPVISSNLEPASTQTPETGEATEDPKAGQGRGPAGTDGIAWLNSGRL